MSDGIYSPEEVVVQAQTIGLEIISITDHDTIRGISRALNYANIKNINLRIIPGVEINTNWKGEEVHILGYFIDYKSTYLEEELKRLREGRVRRNKKIVEKLKMMGMDIKFEEVLSCAQGETLGRPHIAKVIVKKGFAPDLKSAFIQYLEPGRPGFVPRESISPLEAIKLIERCGGIPFLAHPGLLSSPLSIIWELKEGGLKGLEVYYPGHKEGDNDFFEKKAKEYNLLTSGGSDFHGTTDFSSHPMVRWEIPFWVKERLNNEKEKNNEVTESIK